VQAVGPGAKTTYNRPVCSQCPRHSMSSRTSNFTAPVVHICVAAFVAATAFGAWGAGAPDVAHGTFKSQAITLEVRSAIAFKGKSYLGADDVLIVAVTNAKVHGDALADYYDRKRAVEK